MEASGPLGDNPYGRQSSICSAARHAGAIKAQGGQVTIIPVESVPFFPGVMRNGVQSNGSDRADAGFRVIVPGMAQRPDPVAADGSINLDICPGNHYSTPMDAPALTCGCSASAMKEGSIVGDNPYARGSSLCHAALHAGALTSRGGQVTIVPDENVPFFPAITRNGINSSGNDQSSPGFRVMVPGASPKATSFGDDGSINLEICPANYYSVPMDAPSLTCLCPIAAMNEGSLVGDNPYGRQSGICRAAMHTGALTSRGGQVTATPVAGAPFFPAVQRNGINSSQSDAGPGFRIVVPNPVARPSVAAPDQDARIDASGHPIQKPIAPTLQSAGVVQVYINFVTNSAELQSSAEPVLRELLETLQRDQALRINLIGHTDANGTSVHNQDLSERRAAAVYYWLVRNGINRDRLRSSGRGFAEPIAVSAQPG
jgi:outer membrane protein OmpA-like peptidoglycan-associated protein